MQFVQSFLLDSCKNMRALIHEGVILKVQSTFRDFNESNILRPYMSDAIKEIVKACQALEGKESAPSSAGNDLLFKVSINK